MRWHLFLLVLLCTISCKQPSEKTLEKGPFDYLLGKWERTNEKEGQQTFETWTHTSQTLYTGHAYTLKRRDTVFNERMQLKKMDSLWILEVSGPNEHPVFFSVITHTSSSFIAQNPEHDFPTEISYRYFDDTITATVSGGETTIPFVFWRLEE